MAKAAIIDDIQESVAARFEEVQTSVANHRKNCVALYKLHVQAGRVGDGETVFEDAVLQMVARVLVVKKGQTAERVVRFVGAYVRHLNTKVAEEQAKKGGEAEGETIASRFTTRVLNWLLEGFKAKNKVVRGRVVQIVSEMMASIGDIDEDTYNLLRYNLVQRARDKEAGIRVYAVLSLAKLIGTETPDDLEDGEKTALELVMDAVSFDPAPEVRRAALVSIPVVNQDTIPTVLERMRDTDTTTRKLVYSAVLQTKLPHPKTITILQREEVVKVGLGDREPAVRLAVSKMLAAWFDFVCADENDEADTELEGWAGDDGGVMKGFIHFLCIFDVLAPGVTMAIDAVRAILTARPALAEAFVFPDEYWTHVIPESAVLARVFVEHCHDAGKQDLLDKSGLPVLSVLAFQIQEQFNYLVAQFDALRALGEEDEEETERLDENVLRGEMILRETIQMTLYLDFGDEMGRRTIFRVIRQILTHTELRDALIEPALDMLRLLTTSEKELIRVVVEIVSDLRDGEEPEEDVDDNRSDAGSVFTTTTSKKDAKKPKEDMSPEEQRLADAKDFRALNLCIGMLERVNSAFEDNVTLEGMLADLIIPAVKRKDLAMREKGLLALGLCCLIAKNMALNSFQLFLSQIQTAPEELRVKVLQIVFDILVMYEYEFLGRSEDVAQQIITFLLQMLEAEEVPQVQAVLCVGICKLLLAGLIQDTKVLLLLVVTYISPSTAENLELRQCLTYFFPVYCYSSLANQARMQSIFVEAFDHAAELRADLEEEEGREGDMVSMQQFASMMADWTDQERSVDVLQDQAAQKNIHALVAIDIVKALYDSERGDDDKKVLCTTLNQLHVGKELGSREVLMLGILLEHLEAQCPLNNTAMDRAVNKFRGTMGKLFGDALGEIMTGLGGGGEEVGEGAGGAVIDDEVRALCEFLNVDVPTGDGDEGTVTFGKMTVVGNTSTTSRAGRRDTSVMEGGDGDGDGEPSSTSAPTPAPRSRTKSKGKGKGKGKGKAESDDDEEFTTAPREAPVSPMKASTKRRVRSASRGGSPVRKKRSSVPPAEVVPETPSRRSSRQTRTPKVRTYAEPEDEVIMEEAEEEEEAAEEGEETSMEVSKEEVSRDDDEGGEEEEPSMEVSRSRAEEDDMEEEDVPPPKPKSKSKSKKPSAKAKPSTKAKGKAATKKAKDGEGETSMEVSRDDDEEEEEEGTSMDASRSRAVEEEDAADEEEEEEVPPPKPKPTSKPKSKAKAKPAAKPKPTTKAKPKIKAAPKKAKAPVVEEASEDELEVEEELIPAEDSE